MKLNRDNDGRRSEVLLSYCTEGCLRVRNEPGFSGRFVKLLTRATLRMSRVLTSYVVDTRRSVFLSRDELDGCCPTKMLELTRRID